jgi:hypothetical protein
MDFLVEPGIIQAFLDHAMPWVLSVLFGLVNLSAMQPGYGYLCGSWLGCVAGGAVHGAVVVGLLWGGPGH